MDGITTCLWFDRNGEEAATFYVDLFPDSCIDRVTRGPTDWPAGSAGDVLIVDFTLFGRPFQALNGGDFAHFNEAVSLSIACETQDEVDRYWSALSADPEAEQCGWVKDRFGLSWQIVPTVLPTLIADPDREKAARVMHAIMAMKKLDIAAIERAAAD
ncbi:VOC family protein [Pararhizobium mangrovi]|uniref:VOC family protein n=1 Tax=Pararhizobium mangrovi TaxID=2590452 RepID=A0A506TWK5_9HYPH|nr:VOC family protein [Pararhizobium mangrovi]TPW26443.1 VOC family protein [Pararhizobium mangrovi]